MSEQPPPATATARLHALDNLRALLMWLGIVLHVSAIYAIQPLPNAWRDGQRTVWADLVVSSVHAFRMPAFFILAGFFTALLVQSRGPGGLLRHRLARLALPFALFWPLLWAATGLSAWLFLNRMALGHGGLDAPAVPAMGWLQQPNTLHLWFLWLLLWFNLATAALLRLPRAWFAPVAAVLAWLARRPWGFVVLALPVWAAGLGYPGALVVVSNAFRPPWNEGLYYGMFFVFGLVLHARQTELFPQLQRQWALCAAGGLAFYALTGAEAVWHGPLWLMAYSYNCATWLWCFAAIGLSLRLLGSPNARLAYLSDSAYWVYLVHYPLTILFGAVLFEWPLPALLKIALNTAATTLVCLLSYQLCVRHTGIGQLLNGKRHPRATRGTPPATGMA